MVVLTSSPLALELQAKFFRGLADPARLVLLEALRDGEMAVGALVAATGLSQPTVSRHLACLRECGLVESRQEWRHVYYRLADERLKSLLDLADGVLFATAQRIYACVNIPFPEAGTPRERGTAP